MVKYNVSQLVDCVVRVWYEVEGDTFEDVMNKIAKNTSPTDKSINGTDYEIIEDRGVIRTVITEAD